MSPPPWHNWYHVMSHTYGTWLPGDSRGFHTRHLREHVDGDYKRRPPKGKWDFRLKRSKELMKRDPVYLAPDRQRVVAEEILTSLSRRDIPFLALALDKIHLHLLAQFDDRNPRHWVGIAKKESAHHLKTAGLSNPGGIWGIRCECKPIVDRSHLLNVIKYIDDHRLKGAVVLHAPKSMFPVPGNKFPGRSKK